MKELFLLRGLPGSGKSTVAKSLGGTHHEADHFFTNKKGEYKFEAVKLLQAHKYCQSSCKEDMENGEERIVISNTFTQEWEMETYYTLAKKYGYIVYALIVENRHNGVNQHGVPVEKLKQMEDRFEIQL